MFVKPEVPFLAQKVNALGISSIQEKVEAINKYQLPKTIKELRRFLGMIDFYRRFLRKAAEGQTLLISYLIRSKKKNDNETTTKRKMNGDGWDVIKKKKSYGN